jgi:acyl carrier protein
VPHRAKRRPICFGGVFATAREEKSQLVAPRQFIAAARDLPLDVIRADMDLDCTGLSSADLVWLTGELEERLKIEISPTVLLDAASISEAAENLVSLVNQR